MPGFDFFGVPERCSAVEVCDWFWGAVVGYIVCPGAGRDADVGGAVCDAPEFTAGIGVDDGGAH